MTTSAPGHLVALAATVDVRLRTVLAAERSRWEALDPELGVVFDSLEGLTLGSGKCLRPAFCHWGWIGAGVERCVTAGLAAGAAFELLHAFALFHDDVMDGSATRRGQMTTHLVFADRHTRERWRGEARRFGEGVAILVGDLAFVYADTLLRGAPPVAQRMWDELRIELNIGQYLDVVGTASGLRDHVKSERIARYKSGKYTVERPLHLGAALAAPDRFDDHFAEALSGYGLPLGDAFQLRDDVLGVFGDPVRIGKPVGDDLREGKPTPLLSLACERATSAQQELLAQVGTPDLDEPTIVAMQQVLVQTGALADIETRIELLTKEALDALVDAPITGEAKDALAELAHYVAWRES
jgi:geranylgeranyl diphosphate synthase, type I